MSESDSEFSWDEEATSKFDQPMDESELSDPDYSQPEEPIADIPGYDAIFGAPDFAKIVGKGGQSQKSRSYERKVQSMEKTIVLGALKRNNFADAAAILKEGPAFARAVGDASVDNKRVASMVDMITAPDSPMFILTLSAISLFSQLARNHEPQLQQIQSQVKSGWRERRQARKSGTKLVNDREPYATSTFNLPFRKKPVTIKWRVRVPFVGIITRGVLGNSVDPVVLTRDVFSDENVIKALEKQGIVIEMRRADGN